MTKKAITWGELELKLKTPNFTKRKTAICPVCGNPRSKGDHQKCSKITQQRHLKERGEI